MLDIEKYRLGKFKEDRMGYALRGENPTMLARLRSGFVFLNDRQLLPGWCILSSYPKAADLHCLPFDKRQEFLADMGLVGEAIQAVTQPVRMNYSILGNTDNYLHAHIYPRYQWEEPARLRRPAWFYDGTPQWTDPQYELNESHVALAEDLARKIEELKGLYYKKD